MNRKFLEDMGLSKEQVDSIMEANGQDMEAAKGGLSQAKTELEQTKAQLQEANQTIEGFNDYEQTKSQVEEYKAKYEQSKAEYENQIADMKFSSALDAAITAAGGRNVKAVSALLDIEALKKSKDQSADIATALEACKKENEYLFGSAEPINSPVGPTGGKVTGLTKEQFKNMGYQERLELKQKDPAKYEEMKG